MKTKLLTGIIAAALAVTGCGANVGRNEDREINEIQKNVAYTTQEENAEDICEEAPDARGYAFSYEGTVIQLDADFDVLLEELPESKSVYEAPSCAGQGTAYVYNYGAFEVETYPRGGKNLAGYIILLDDSVATAEGVDLSMTKADVIAAYGETYTESDTGIAYEAGNMRLTFIFEDGYISSIIYASLVMAG